MKYLVLFAVLAVVYMMWKHQRQASMGARDAARRQAPGHPPSRPQDMVRCPVCSLHLPRGDAVADAQGHLFCSVEHRDASTRPPRA